MAAVVTAETEEKQQRLLHADAGDIRMIGPWEVHHQLGEGMSSKVKLGIHKETRQQVALKLILKSSTTKSALSMEEAEDTPTHYAQREVDHMQRIKHRNVTRVLDVVWDAKYKKKNGDEQDVILVVLELATGGELFDMISFSGRFEENMARTYFHQLIEGVEECHKQGVAHRDLKPENLLLDEHFTLKIADFGFSTLFDHLQPLCRTQLGTATYQAPEITQGGAYDPCLADTWALGVILFIMLAGFPPFQSPSRKDWWFAKLVTGKHARFWEAHSRTAYFSDSAKDLINKILNPTPTQRITIPHIKRHPWYTGHTIGPRALEAECRLRNAVVDQRKATPSASSSSSGDLDDVALYRDIDGISIPVDEPEERAPEAVDKEAFVITTLNSFLTKLKPEAALDKIINALNELTVHVVTEPGTNTQRCVFRRGHADVLQFGQVMRSVRKRLTPISVAPSPPSPTVSVSTTRGQRLELDRLALPGQQGGVQTVTKTAAEAPPSPAMPSDHPGQYAPVLELGQAASTSAGRTTT